METHKLNQSNGDASNFINPSPEEVNQVAKYDPDLDDEVTCPVCLEKYGESAEEPSSRCMLKCGHYLCQNCSKTNTKILANKKEACPFCWNAKKNNPLFDFIKQNKKLTVHAKFVLSRNPNLVNESRFNPNTGKEETPIVYAIQQGNEEAVQDLLDNYADITIRHTKEQITPLMYAIDEGNANIVEILIKKNPIIITQADKHGKIPLKIALSNDQTEMVTILLRHTNLGLMDESEIKQILEHAIKKSNEEILDLLMNKNHKIIEQKITTQNQYPLEYATQSGNKNIVKYFVEKQYEHLTQEMVFNSRKISKNNRNSQIFTLLTLKCIMNIKEAVQYNDYEKTKTFLEKNPKSVHSKYEITTEIYNEMNEWKKEPVKDEQDLLMIAIYNHVDLKIIDLLFEYKIDIDYISTNKDTAMIAAIRTKSTEFAIYLLEHGVSEQLYFKNHLQKLLRHVIYYDCYPIFKAIFDKLDIFDFKPQSAFFTEEDKIEIFSMSLAIPKEPENFGILLIKNDIYSTNDEYLKRISKGDEATMSALMYAIKHNMLNVVDAILEKYPDEMEKTNLYGIFPLSMVNTRDTAMHLTTHWFKYFTPEMKEKVQANENLNLDIRQILQHPIMAAIHKGDNIENVKKNIGKDELKNELLMKNAREYANYLGRETICKFLDQVADAQQLEREAKMSEKYELIRLIRESQTEPAKKLITKMNEERKSKEQEIKNLEKNADEKKTEKIQTLTKEMEAIADEFEIKEQEIKNLEKNADEKKTEEIQILTKEMEAIADEFEISLIYAAKFNKGEILLSLLKLKPRPNVEFPDPIFGNTALLKAAEAGNTEIVKTLIHHQNNANIIHQNKQGNTAAMLAAKNNHHDIVEILITNKPSKNAVYKQGQTMGQKNEKGETIFSILLYKKERTPEIDNVLNMIIKNIEFDFSEEEKLKEKEEGKKKNKKKKKKTKDLQPKDNFKN